MFSAFSVGNFKAFGTTQSVPLKPITLVFGPNSAGKSSLIHALLFAQESARSGNLDVHRPEAWQETVDLGGFRQFTHRANPDNKVTLSFRLARLEALGTWNLTDVTLNAVYFIRQAREKLAEDFRESLRQTLAKAYADDELLREIFTSMDPEEAVGDSRNELLQRFADRTELADDPPEILSFELSVGAESLLRASSVRGKGLRLSSLNLDHPSMRQFLESLVSDGTSALRVSEQDLATVREAVNALVPEIQLSTSGLLPNDVVMETEAPPAAFVALERDRSEPTLREITSTFLLHKLRVLVRAAFEAVAQPLRELRYLGPLRKYPARHFAFDAGRGETDAEGMFAWRKLRDDGALREKVNTWLGSDFLQTKYELKVDHMIPSGLLAESLESAIGEEILEKRLKYDEMRDAHNASFGGEGPVVFSDEVYAPYDAWDEKQTVRRLLREIMLRSAGATVRDLTLRDKRTETTVSHRDIGIGVSQVLPVLVYAFTERSAFIAMEQPEIHLHPALQAELADVFIESALGQQRNTFLLETHSEHLILRILRRIREGRNAKVASHRPIITAGDVSILFVQPSSRGSEIRELRVDDRGRLIDPWPGGFFEESFNELF